MSATAFHTITIAVACLALIANVIVIRNVIKTQKLVKQVQREAARTVGAAFFKNSQR